MKVLKAAFTLYTGFLLPLLLFPPWSELGPTWRDRVFYFVGHHWRFSPPYYWGYIDLYSCIASSGRKATCGGDSVWRPDEAARVDYRLLKYEAAIGLVASTFFTLIVYWAAAGIPFALSRLRSSTLWVGLSRFNGK